MAQLKRPDSIFNTLLAVFRISLVLIGLVGLAVEMFRDNGWLRQMLAKMMESPLGLASIPLAIVLLYGLNLWISSASYGTTSKGDLPLYLMMAIGAFFLYQLMTTGAF